MKQEITVPSPGESVTSGILAKWLIEDGASVSQGDEVFELETDKATLAVPAPTAGTLHHKAAEGAEVEVGQVVAEIDTDGRGAAKTEQAQPERSSAGEPESKPDDAAEKESASKTTANESGPAPSDAAAELAREHDIDLNTIEGSGKDGRIVKKDVSDAVARAGEDADTRPAKTEAAEPATRPAPKPVADVRRDGRQTREPMSNLRKRIAENLVSSRHNSAHLTTFNEIDMKRIMDIRKSYGEAFEKRHGVRLGFMSIFVRAVCQAQQDFPGVNAFVDGDDILYNHYHDIGVAVSTERGLIVPVIRDAETKSFAELEKTIRDLAERARNKSLSVDDLIGGTFTITNGGIFGSLLSTPIPTPPQTAILGMHTIQKRPVVVEDAIVIRPMMYVALTYDHRVIDGREAVGFLAKVKAIVEDPQSLLFEL